MSKLLSNNAVHTAHHILNRCQQRHRVWVVVRAFEVFSRLAWPGFVLLLALLIVTTALGISHFPLLLGLALWFVFCVVQVVRKPQRWQVPTWRLPAYLDRHSGSHGALLRLYETGQGAGQVPKQADQLAFPRILPKHLVWTWLGLLLGFMAWYLMPTPASSQTFLPTHTPIPIQRAEDLLLEVIQQKKSEDPWVESAEETLEKLHQRTGGLRREDFDALEQLTTTATEKLLTAQGHLHHTDLLLADLEQLAAEVGADPDESARKAGELARQLSEQAKSGKAGSLSAEQLQQILQQAHATISPTGDNTSQNFDSSKLAELQQQIRESRAKLKQEMQQLQACLGKGGVTRGPGSAPLQFSHLAFQREEATLESKTFSSQEGKPTVLLAESRSQRPEKAQPDPMGLTDQSFTQGTDTRYWQKQTLPKHRQLLERYFDQ